MIPEYDDDDDDDVGWLAVQHPTSYDKKQPGEGNLTINDQNQVWKLILRADSKFDCGIFNSVFSIISMKILWNSCHFSSSPWKSLGIPSNFHHRDQNP